MTDAERWRTSTDPDELLEMWIGISGYRLPPGGYWIQKAIAWDALIRIAHLLKPEHGITLDPKHQEYTIDHSAPEHPRNWSDVLRWARAVEVEDARRWANALPESSPRDQMAARRRIAEAYAEHAARAYQVAVIRRAVGNPFEEEKNRK